MFWKRYIFAHGFYLHSSRGWEKPLGRRRVTMASPAGYSLKHIFSSRLSPTQNSMAPYCWPKSVWNPWRSTHFVISHRFIFRSHLLILPAWVRWCHSSDKFKIFCLLILKPRINSVHKPEEENLGRNKARRYQVPQYPHYVGHPMLKATWRLFLCSYLEV